MLLANIILQVHFSSCTNQVSDVIAKARKFSSVLKKWQYLFRKNNSQTLFVKVLIMKCMLVVHKLY